MVLGFLDIASTPSVIAAQEANGSRSAYARAAGQRVFDRFTERENEFITARDSFYVATVSETGWPYVQHRGGPAGFLRVLDERTLAFADFRGNRQYISLGNATANNRVALILMDYPNRRRLKIYARIEAKDLLEESTLAEKIASPQYKATPERAMLLHLAAFDWNCFQHITPRFTAEEVAMSLVPMRERLEQLEAENRMLREKLRMGPTTEHPI